MARPNTRASFKEYCLRSLGKPVIDINVDEDQIEDRIDEAVQYFSQYHTDGVERMYLKYKVTAEDKVRLRTNKEFNVVEWEMTLSEGRRLWKEHEKELMQNPENFDG